ncbi:MAG: hypothetical protein HY910_11810 [Desulfarculus sp.]|nr:hypothetical protein [Desulfarculus sp.]
MSHCCKGAPGGGPGPRRPLFRDDPETMDQIKALEAEIADLNAQQQACDQEVKDLAQREMAGEGPFAAQIHALKQRKMVLVTEAQHKKVRINALLATW